ncbi:hypothetical protein FMN50_17860 [Rhodobacterales bacterium]|nr:hypothetical protein FMN50_17860 [Rhodobacterales bacterium]
MTFDKKREQILLATDIGKVLDGEGAAEERARLLGSIEDVDGGDYLMERMDADNRLLQRAIPASVPQDSLDRFQAVIDREFAKRKIPAAANSNWSGMLVQTAAALLLVAGTFMFTTYWMQSRMDDAVASLAARMETERTLIAQTVQEALETRVSGEPIQISHEGNWVETFTPVHTYKSTSGHWCRQYVRETRFGGMDMSIQGTACRDESGTWTTVFAEPVSGDFAQQPPGI